MATLIPAAWSKPGRLSSRARTSFGSRAIIPCSAAVAAASRPWAISSLIRLLACRAERRFFGHDRPRGSRGPSARVAPGQRDQAERLRAAYSSSGFIDQALGEPPKAPLDRSSL